MSVRNLLTVNTIYIGLIALGAIFAPSTMLETSGLDVNDVTISLMRTVGAVVVGYAVISWLMRDEEASPARRAFLLGGGIAYLVVAAVFVIHALSGIGNAMGWVYAVINLVLGAAFVNYGRP